MKKIFIIKAGSTFPETAAKYGDFEDLTKRGLATNKDVEILTVDACQGEELPSAEDCHAAVITGAHCMVTDDLPWSLTIEAWLPDLVQAHKSISIPVARRWAPLRSEKLRHAARTLSSPNFRINSWRTPPTPNRSLPCLPKQFYSLRMISNHTTLSASVAVPGVYNSIPSTTGMSCASMFSDKRTVWPKPVRILPSFCMK